MTVGSCVDTSRISTLIQYTDCSAYLTQYGDDMCGQFLGGHVFCVRERQYNDTAITDHHVLATLVGETNR